LQIQPGRDELGLDIHLLCSAESESPQSVPLLGFGEARFDPDLPFRHRFRVILGLVVTTDPIQGRFIETPADPLDSARGRALRPERAGRTSRRRRLVGASVTLFALRNEAEHPVSRTGVDVGGCVGNEIRVSEQTRPVTDRRQRQVRMDALPLNRGGILDGAIFVGAGHLSRMELPAEACRPEEIKRRLVVRHVGRGH
jgi:hypothetical protein